MRTGPVTGPSALSITLTAVGVTKALGNASGPAAAFDAILASVGADQACNRTSRIPTESAAGLLSAPDPAPMPAAKTIVPEPPAVPVSTTGQPGIVDSKAAGPPSEDDQPAAAFLAGSATPAGAVVSKPGVRPGGAKATPLAGAEDVVAGQIDPASAFPPQSGQALASMMVSPEVGPALSITAAGSPEVVASGNAPPDPGLPAMGGSEPWAAASGPSTTDSPAGPSPAPPAPADASPPTASPAGAAPRINDGPAAANAAPAVPMMPGMAGLVTTSPKAPAARPAAARQGAAQDTPQPAHPGAPRALNTNAAAVNLRKLDPAIPVSGVSDRPAPNPVIPVTEPEVAVYSPTTPLTGSPPNAGRSAAAVPAMANPAGTAPWIDDAQGAAASVAATPDALVRTAIAAPASVVLPGQAPATLRIRNAMPASDALTSDAQAPVAAAGILHMQGSIGTTEVSSTSVGKLAAAPAPSALPGVPASVLDQVTPAVVSAAQAGDAGHRVSVSLNPDQLGTVTVTVDRNTDGTMHIQVSAEQIATLDMLRRDQGELVRALDQTATGHGSPGLSFSLDSGSGGGWSMPGGQQDPRPPLHFPPAYADETANATSWPGASKRAAAGSIDVTA